MIEHPKHNKVLSQHYNIHNAVLTEVQPGWSALAYHVRAGRNHYFLKVFDKTRHSSIAWIQKIDRYIPAVIWLYQQTSLRGRIPHIVPAADNNYKYEDEKHVYILYDWIDGHTPREEPLTSSQLSGLSQIIADLHCFNEEVPALNNLEREYYDIPFFETLMSRAVNSDENIPHEYVSLIIEKLHQLSASSKALSAKKIPQVLCHNDIHGWNVITQNHRLILLDWEGLKFAPSESDLFMFKYERYWGNRWEEFYSIYRKTHINNTPDETAMQFFRLRRRLEDIDAFIDNIVLDNASSETQAEAKQAIIRECGLL